MIKEATMRTDGPTTTAERMLFTVAGAFNWLLVLAFVFGGDLAWRILGLAEPADRLFLHLFLVFVGLFGLAYFWIGREIRGKAPLILLSIAGKLSVVAVMVCYWLAGNIPSSAALPAAGDVLFAGLFAWTLRRRC
jgi:hypothetical protein